MFDIDVPFNYWPEPGWVAVIQASTGIAWDHEISAILRCVVDIRL